MYISWPTDCNSHAHLEDCVGGTCLSEHQTRHSFTKCEYSFALQIRTLVADGIRYKEERFVTMTSTSNLSFSAAIRMELEQTDITNAIALLSSGKSFLAQHIKSSMMRTRPQDQDIFIDTHDDDVDI